MFETDIRLHCSPQRSKYRLGEKFLRFDRFHATESTNRQDSDPLYAEENLQRIDMAMYISPRRNSRGERRMSKMVERTLDFLELFAEHRRPLQLTEISRLVKIPISSCHDVLRALESRGYIYELAPRAGYYPTLRLLDIARTIADHDPVATRAEIVLRDLRDSTDETVLLCKTDGVASTYLLSFEPSHALRFMVRIGESIRNLYATSAGKALMASWDVPIREAFLDNTELLPLTQHTITTAPALRADLDLGRRRGWFLNKEESIEGLVTLSAPFLWNGSQFIVTIAAPASRVGDRLEALAARLLQACEALEMRAGSR